MGSRASLTYGVRELAGKGFYRSRCTAVGVTFTQYRVNGAAQYFGVTCVDFFLFVGFRVFFVLGNLVALLDRKSTRLNSSHVRISYAVFCLKKKTQHNYY